KTQITIKMKNRTREISADPSATPPKPKTAAITEIMRNTKAHFKMADMIDPPFTSKDRGCTFHSSREAFRRFVRFRSDADGGGAISRADLCSRYRSSV